MGGGGEGAGEEAGQVPTGSSREVLLHSNSRRGPGSRGKCLSWPGWVAGPVVGRLVEGGEDSRGEMDMREDSLVVNMLEVKQLEERKMKTGLVLVCFG